MDKKYSIITVRGYEHVVCDTFHKRTNWPEANYLGTGKALCGVIKKGQSFENWLKKRNHKKK